MNEGYIDWKGRALAAEAETLNLKNLCAHHGICTACGEYYSHHYIEPFATCNCNTSEWFELTEYMKLQDELRKLREQKPIKYLYRVTDCFGHDVLRDDPKGATILETIPLFAAPVPAPAVPELDPMTRLIVSDPKQLKPKKQEPAVPSVVFMAHNKTCSVIFADRNAADQFASSCGPSAGVAITECAVIGSQSAEGCSSQAQNMVTK